MQMNALIQICLYARISVKIKFDVFRSLLDRNTQIARKPKIADSIYDAEINGLSRASKFARNLVKWHAEYFARGRAVDVLVCEEGRNETFVLRDVGEHAQFDLRIVARDEPRVIKV